MATRRVLWVLVALAGVAPGCLGDVGEPVGRTWTVGGVGAVADVRDDPIALAELRSDDCVEMGAVASSQGADVEWSLVGDLGETALLSIDGIVACSIPSNRLGPAERIEGQRQVIPIARRTTEPKPDESGPNPEPASADHSGPNPEPASGEAGVIILKSGGPDESGPNPEPASGGSDESGPNPEPADPGSSSSGGGDA